LTTFSNAKTSMRWGREIASLTNTAQRKYGRQKTDTQLAAGGGLWGCFRRALTDWFDKVDSLSLLLDALLAGGESALLGSDHVCNLHMLALTGPVK
jgi:hypothetical protein